MGVFLFSILFEIKYECLFGDCVYVLGNIPELGEWQINKALKLKWKEKNVWSQKLNLKIDNNSFIQYKYVIAPYHPQVGEVKRWECGPNRILSLKNITKLEFSMIDIWGFRKVSLRLSKQENNENPIFISGNVADLGDFKFLKPMNLIKKKSSLFIDETYWEKSILFPNDFPYDLVYNFFQLNKENNCIMVNECNFTVNVLDDIKFPSFEKLWSPQINPEKRVSHFKQMTISPFKINKNTKNNMRISLDKNKPKRLEKKYNSIHIFNELTPLKSFIKEINKELIIGNNCLNESDIVLLEKEKIDSIIVFKNTNAIIHENNRFVEDSISKVCKNPNISTYIIYSNQINRDDPSNLMAWAQTLDSLAKNNKKIFVCWSDCKEEMFEILLHYLHHFKHFSFKAANKFLNLKSNFKF